MANGIENIEIKSQPQEEIEISTITDKIAFNCPHCYKEINETHLDEKGRYFQSIKEKIRKTTEEVLNSQKAIQKKQLLEQIEAERSYEKFGEVIKKDEVIEELKKTTKKLEEENLQLILKSKEDLAKATSYDEIRKLEGFKELEKKVDEYQKEIEELKVGKQPEIKELTEINKNLEKDLAEARIKFEKDLREAKSPECIMDSKLYKELKEEHDRYKEDNKKFNDKDYIENTKRVKDLEAEKKQLNDKIQELKDQGRMSKKKGEDLEKFVIEQLQTTYNGTDTITKITHTGEKADISQTIYHNQLPVGKVIYEIKNVDKWDNKWLEKLEKDMANDKADYGIIVATCRVGNPLWKPFPQKNILVSDDDNFIFASQMARLLILNRQRFQESEAPEERIKKFEEWMREKFPNYLLNFEKHFNEWEKDLGRINTSVKSMEKIRGDIKKSVISQMEMELKNI